MEIDLLNPESFAQGHPLDQYAWLQDNAPLYWHGEPSGPGFWVVSRYEDVAGIGRHPHIFSNEPTITIEDPDTHSAIFAGDEHKTMSMMDPPQHTQFRRIISGEFTRGSAAGLRPRIAELAAKIIDKVIDRGECEFVSEVAGELPPYVIAELIGISLDDGRELYKLTEIIHAASTVPESGARHDAMQKIFAYALQVYHNKLAHPTGDLASQIAHAQVEGRRLDEIDFQLFFMLLIDAGGDTTRNLVAGGLYKLIQNPDQLAEWRMHRTEMDESAREELLRAVSPVIYMRRTAVKDTELHGKTIKAGDKVVRYFGAANYDPRKFESPHALNLNRFPNEQIAFGVGTHVCLGQHIARVEIDCIFHEILARMKDFQLAEPPRWLESNFISGLSYMPLTFNRA